MYVTVGVKLSIIGGEGRDVWEGWKYYMYHKTSHCLTRKCQKLSQFSNFWSPKLHQLPSRNTTNNRLLHTKHMPLPKKWHFYIHYTMSYVFFATFVWSIVLCVCPWIDSSGKNKFILYQPLAHLHFRYHRQFEHHSNWFDIVDHESFGVWIGNTIIGNHLV